jgi:hypothetical protein
MKAFIEANGGIIGATLLVMVSFNLFLAGLSAALEKTKDHTATDVDNKAYALVSKVSAFLSKVVDMIGYNPKH